MNELILHEIITAHSPATLKGKITNGAKTVQVGFETGGDEGMDTMILGVEILNQAIARYKLLKQTESRIGVLHDD